MAHKIGRRDNRYLARLVTRERAPCAFCLRDVDDEITYGKLYAIGDIQCHYFCCLLSCCLIQKGHDEEGLFGFMYPDILTEVERCKKHKCSYCGRAGANLGCSVGVCRKQFHLPCGRDKNAVSLYYGTYKTFCQQHAPKQKIPDHIMARAQLRKRVDRIKGKPATKADLKIESDDNTEQMVCVICYEAVDGFPTVNTFWPPCCRKDAWFHRTCLQRMALSAGMHYLKCPLCNDKDSFYDAVVNQGYYVPDRDAAWELEQNAFAEIYERAAVCGAEMCLCVKGREHDEETGKWDIKLCLLCGSAGAHAECILQSQPSKQENLSLDQSEKIAEVITSTDQSETKGLSDLSVEANGSRNEGSLSLEQPNIFEQLNPSPTQSTPSDQLNISFVRLNTSTNPNTSPSEPNTSPSEPNTSPSEPTTSPSQQNTSPCEPTTSPTQSNPADQLNTFSARLNTSPSQLNTSPDKSTTCVRYVCRSCLPAAPEDLEALASSLEAMIQREQAQNTSEARPVMTSRMSLRRTKGRRPAIDRPSTSRIVSRMETDSNKSSESDSSNVASSRLELNLKTPRRLHSDAESTVRDCTETKLLSPLKLLVQSFREKMVSAGVRDTALDATLVETLRKRFRKPRPLCERRRIVEDILNGIFDDLLKDSKEQEKEWCSPKKGYNSIEDSKEVQYDFKDLPKGLEDNEGKENDSNASNTPSKGNRNHKIGETILNLVKREENMKNDVTEHHSVDENMKNNVREHQTEEHNQHKATQLQNEENIKNINVPTLRNEDEDIKYNPTKYDNSHYDLKSFKVEQKEVKIEETLSENTTEQCDSLERVKNTLCDVEMKELSRKSAGDSRKNSRDNDDCETEHDSNSNTDIRRAFKHCNENYEDTNKVKDRSNASESFRKTRNSIKPIFHITNNSNKKKENSNETSKENATSTKANETSKNLHQSFSKDISENSLNESMKIDETNTFKNKYYHSEQKENDTSDKTAKITKKSRAHRRKRSKKDKRRSLKGVEKSRHSFKNNPFDDIQKLRSKSESSTDISILKRLAEKDLRSQLLLELTTGKVHSKNTSDNSTRFETRKYKNETQTNSTETPKLVNDAPKCFHETPKTSKSSDRSRKSSFTTKYSNETIQSQKVSKPKTLKDLGKDQKDSNLRKDLDKTSSSIQKTGDVLESFSKSLKTNDKKTTKPPVEGPKSFEKALSELDQLISNKSKNKSIKNSKVSSKVSNKTHKSKTPNTESPMNLESNPNSNSSIDIPKHKTIEIQHDSSLEISENDQHINIDVIKIEDSPTTDESYKNLKIKLPVQRKTCFKFSPIEDSLDKSDVGIDLESFKKEYLSEVDREFKCKFKHKHARMLSPEQKFRSPIDFAIEAAMQKVENPNCNRKRKLSESEIKLVFDKTLVKRRKTSEGDLKLVYYRDKKIPESSEGIDKMAARNNEDRKKMKKEKRRKRETKERHKTRKDTKKSSSDKNIEVTIDSSEKRRTKNKEIKKKIKTKFAIKNDNIQVKIKWKKERFSLNIESKKQDKKKKNIKDDRSKFKQYVLQFPEGSSKEVLVKPEKEVGPLKRKYFRNEKSPDKLKQMSIQSFFKVKPEK